MSGIIVKGNIPKALKPGVDKFWGDYSQRKMQWEELFDKYTNDEAYVEDVLVSDFTSAPIKEEGSGVKYTSNGQKYITRYNHISYALGFQVSREAKDDGKYYDVVMKNMPRLADAMMRTKEIVGANVYNKAFNAGITYGDGAQLITGSHNTDAGLQSNRLSVDAPLSETSIEDMLIQISNTRSFDGNFMAVQGRKLIVPNALQFEAERILKTELRPATANNDLNAMKNMGMLPEGFVTNQYLTSPTAFFIRTDVADGMKYFDRTTPEFSQDEDFDAEVHKYKIYSRCSFGNTDWRAIFGTTGA
jgi:hypothetical protein